MKMKGDFSRFSFDRKKRYSAVLMQQGRLQLDSDWNEHVLTAEHRNASFFRELMGRRSGTPAGNKMELKVDEEGVLTLAPGGIFYIDGLLIENGNEEPTNLETPDDGDYLYYLDAWAREVDAIEDENLIDPALGQETTARLRIEWRVRCQPITRTPDLEATYLKGDWPEPAADWERPLSTGKLRIESDPAGSKILKTRIRDNRLYRIEVHQDDAPNAEHFFKWSRNNACVCAEVIARGENSFELKNNDEYTQNTFKNAKWIELSVPGKMSGPGLMIDMAKNGNQFDEGILSIATKPDWMDQAVFEETLEAIEGEKGFNLKICLWDGIFSWNDGDALEKELGITLGYSTDPAEQFCRDGDYWSILVRDGKIEGWEAGVDKSADGVEHHFAALGFVAFSGGVAGEPKLLSAELRSLTNLDLSTKGSAAMTGNLTVTGTLSAGDGSFIEHEHATELLFFGVRRLDFDSGIPDEKTFDIYSKFPDSTWSASSDATWCTVTPDEQDGKTTVTVGVDENDSNHERSATLTFNTTTSNGRHHVRTVTVTQSALLPTPRISGFLPAEAPHGSTLHIFGSHFHPTANRNVVELNGVKAEVKTATATQLTVTVPQNMNCSGKITVTVGSRTCASADRFTYAVVVDTFAGSGVIGFADGTGTATRFNQSCCIAVDSKGNLYVADRYNHRIRKITPQGVVSTFAGNGEPDFSNGRGTNARFNTPIGITIDTDDNLYVTDTYNQSIRKITPEGDVSTIVGSTPQQQQFNQPHGIAIDGDGNLYVTDYYNHRIRKVTQEGVVTTIAGSAIAGSAPQQGFADGTGEAARFAHPWGITIDALGDLYVVDHTNNCIRKVTQAGVVTTIAGDGINASGNNGRAFADGMGTDARFGGPTDIAIDALGNLYVADFYNSRIRKITQAGEVTTIAGSAQGFADGPGATAQFQNPTAVAVDTKGYLYVSDYNDHRIRKIHDDYYAFRINGFTPTVAQHGSTLTIFGMHFGPTPADNVVKLNDVEVAVETATTTRLTVTVPKDVRCNGHITVTVGSETATSAGRFSYMPTVTTVSTLAGSTRQEEGYRDGTGANVLFRSPHHIAIDAAGDLYLGEWGNHRVRKITPQGVVTTFAGSGPSGANTGAYSNGAWNAAQFNRPEGIAIDADGNFIVTEGYGNRIRKITWDEQTLNWVVSTIAGGTTDVAGPAGHTDATGAAAQFSGPTSIAIDADGNFIVTESSGRRVRKVTPQGKVSLLAGSTTGAEGFTDGTGTNALFRPLSSLAIDATGDIYIADNQNHCIRRVTPQGVVSTFAGAVATTERTGTPGHVNGKRTDARFQNPRGITIDAFGNFYITDNGGDSINAGHRIRMMTPEGVVSTIAGSGTSGHLDSTTGGLTARFNNPIGIALDDSQHLLYVADRGNHCIRRIEFDDYSASLRINSFAPSEASRGSTVTISGMNFGPTPADNVVMFNGIQAVVEDATDTKLTVTVPQNMNCSGRITVTVNRMVATSADRFEYVPTVVAVSTLAGNGTFSQVNTGEGSGSGFVNAQGTAARFNEPHGIAIDASGNLFVGDRSNHRIRKITPQGEVSTFVGSGLAGHVAGTGTQVQLHQPDGIAINHSNQVFVSCGGGSIWGMEPIGFAAILAGSATSGFVNASGAAARFYTPTGIVLSTSGLYIAEWSNFCIRRLVGNAVTTFVGTNTRGYVNGTGTNARFGELWGIVIDAKGDFYVADTGNHCIRKVTPNGVVSTFAGGVATTAGTGTFGHVDDAGTDARFNQPRGIAIEPSSGDFYVTDFGNHCIRRITPDGVVSTVTGTGTAGLVNGPGASARFNSPIGIALEVSGTSRNLYVVERYNHCIRKITLE